MFRTAHSLIDHPAPRWPIAIRWCLLATGLIVELLCLTLRFDSPVAFARDAWWVQLAARAPQFLRLALAFAAAFAVLTAPRLRLLIEDARRSAADYRWWPWVIVHLLAFTTLYFAVRATFGGVVLGTDISVIGLAVCAALGITTSLAWFLTLVHGFGRLELTGDARLALG